MSIWKKYFQNRLQAQKKAQLFRIRKTLDSGQQPEVIIDGRTYLGFCSNDYLGLAKHPDVVNAFKRGAEKYGVGSGASHLVLGHSQAHHALEEELAEFTGRSRVLLFSSGYMANTGILQTLLAKEDAVFEDRLNHASLLDGGLASGARFMRYAHRDVENLRLKLDSAGTGKKLIVSDGVFSMDGDLAPLPALIEESKRHQALLMIDDAHGFGCLGEHGGGVCERYHCNQNEVPVLVGTLGKAFGTAGAFVAGSDELIETLIQFCRNYIYTTALPPAVAEASRESLRRLRSESWRREHLQHLIGIFRQECSQMGFELLDSDTPIQALMFGAVDKAMRASDSLREDGIFVSAIRPPTVPRGKARLRVTFSAAHSERHLKKLLQALSNLAAKNSVV